MRKVRSILMIAAILTTQQVFAHDTSDMGMGMVDKSCATIAHACMKAGFVRAESKMKGMWGNCMKPVILGQTVKGVKVDADVAKACRVHKIEKMKMELEEFEKAN